MKKLLALLLFLCLAAGTALADTTLTGTVVSAGTVTVLAPADGTLASVDVQAGDRIAQGADIASLTITTIYAEQAGTVRVYGAEGASLAQINKEYGAVLYIVPDSVYTLTASTSNAYDTEANKRIEPRELVYLRATASSSRTGIGTVTGVSGSNYIVSVISGYFNSGESVYIYRDSAYAASSRIGRGNITYTGAVGYTGTGEAVSISTSSSSSRNNSSSSSAADTADAETPQSLVSLLVKDGQEVDPGTPLFTVSTASAYAQHMTSPVNGVVTEVAATAGSTVVSGAAIAAIAPDSMMRLALHVPEDDLDKVTLGSSVTIRFLSGETAEGTILSLQGLAEEAAEEEEDEETCFTVYVAFSATPTIAYGMTGKVIIAD